MNVSNKQFVNIVIIGHVDHGKSTLFGDLLIESDTLSEKEKRELVKAGKIYEQDPKRFSFDKLPDERRTGNTIDLSFRKIDMNDKIITLIDAPGHADFVKNMITGASQADAGVLVVSGKKAEAEVGLASNGQAREHLYLAQTLGIKELIVVINKADLWNYEKGRYEEVKELITNVLKAIGYNGNKIPFIPASGKTGENVYIKSRRMKWYTGQSLFGALQNLEIPKRLKDVPLRLPIQDVYHIKGHGTVPVGKVISGVLHVGDNVIINPGNITGEIRSIESHHASLNSAEPGANIGFNIRGNSIKEIRKGFILGHISNPPNVVSPTNDLIIAQIIVINHPTVISAGYTPVCHLATAQTAVKFLSIESKLNGPSGKIIEESPKFIKQGDSAIVRLRTIKKLCAERYSDFPQLGRFAIRDMNRTIAVGKIKEIKKLY